MELADLGRVAFFYESQLGVFQSGSLVLLMTEIR